MLNLPAHDYVKSRAKVDNLISRWGNRAILRRVGAADRYVLAGITQFTAAERMGKVINPLDLHCVFSALDPATKLPLAVAPTDSDVLVTLAVDQVTGKLIEPDQEDQKYRIVAPVIPGVAVNGLILYWDAAIRRY